ncbi:MAG TPA: Sec-independent protein translocase protein TatB [Gallionellaceae bacterium]
MFGIDFSELVVIMVVAVIVIGPEHLPKVARTAGLLWSRAQRYVNGIKSDIEREMEVDELRKMKEEAELQARKLEQQIQQSGRDVMQTSTAQLAQQASEMAPLQQTHEIIEEMERELYSEPESAPDQNKK